MRDLRGLRVSGFYKESKRVEGFGGSFKEIYKGSKRVEGLGLRV